MILEERGVFGGGIIVKVPKDFKDVSQFRQVPDNQEVFVSSTSDETLIIELLETSEDAQEADQGINFHWFELCSETGSTESEIEKTGNFDSEEYGKVSFIIGTQKIPKFGKLKDTFPVKIRLLCLRIPSISSDVLISCSSPIEFESFTNEIFEEICRSFSIRDWSLFKE